MGRRPLLSGFLCHKLHHSFSIDIRRLPIYLHLLLCSQKKGPLRNEVALVLCGERRQCLVVQVLDVCQLHGAREHFDDTGHHTHRHFDSAHGTMCCFECTSAGARVGDCGEAIRAHLYHVVGKFAPGQAECDRGACCMTDIRLEFIRDLGQT